MSEQTTRVRDVFDDWARRGRAEGMERGHGPTARQGFDRLEVGAGTRYLDIGCGNGYTVRWAAAAGARATGLDVSAEMITRARDGGGVGWAVSTSSATPSRRRSCPTTRSTPSSRWRSSTTSTIWPPGWRR